MADLASIGQLVVAAATAMGTTGGGIAWIWSKIEARFAAAKAEHAQTLTKIEAEAERCEARERRSTERHGLLIVVIELLWRVAERHDPDAPELSRADVLMDRYKAIGAEAERKAA